MYFHSPQLTASARRHALGASSCSSNGTVSGTDNAGDCAALLAMYSALGGPSSWSAAVTAGTSSVCSWSPATIGCSAYGRVTTLCAPGRSPPFRPQGGG